MYSPVGYGFVPHCEGLVFVIWLHVIIFLNAETPSSAVYTSVVYLCALVHSFVYDCLAWATILLVIRSAPLHSVECNEGEFFSSLNHIISIYFITRCAKIRFKRNFSSLMSCSNNDGNDDKSGRRTQRQKKWNEMKTNIKVIELMQPICDAAPCTRLPSNWISRWLRIYIYVIRINILSLSSSRWC